MDGTEKNGTRRRPGRRSTPAKLLSALALLILLLLALLAIDGRHVRFYMTDEAEIRVPWGEAYVEPGVRAVAVGRITGESRGELPVRCLGQVDTARLGTYELIYEAKTMLRSYSVKRLVHVVDEEPPVITLRYREGYLPNWFEGYEEEGFSAEDNVDGDVTALVGIREDGDERIYTVSDSSGNTAGVVRRIPYSIGIPTIRLNGGDTLELDAALSFTDPGFSAVDARGNDLNVSVQREGEVVPYAAGSYELRYWLENAVGQRVEAVRTVNVRPLRNPDAVDPDGRIIYLTFDDGPGPDTDRLLDILAAYNVKATFFVTCLYPEYADCIGRAKREGHSIGVHSATHSYREVYASEEAFFEDFGAVQELIFEQTGAYTDLMRFPGGSSNTVSRFNRGVMTRLAATVTELGYTYFDWNITSGDAGETTVTEEVARNIIEGCRQRRVSVVLQHDVKDFSVDAVERVIVWGLTNGYVFAPLDADSPTEHHRIAN